MSPTTDVESLERAVEKLSPEQLVRFRSWFAAFDANVWDQQIEADAAAGKLDELATEAITEYEAGKAQEI
ncbi:MAG: hypothetical protein ACFCU8_00575 [Thermosynechococcaceae cyanobacterium]